MSINFKKVKASLLNGIINGTLWGLAVAGIQGVSWAWNITVFSSWVFLILSVISVFAIFSTEEILNDVLDTRSFKIVRIFYAIIEVAAIFYIASAGHFLVASLWGIRAFFSMALGQKLDEQEKLVAKEES